MAESRKGMNYLDNYVCVCVHIQSFYLQGSSTFYTVKSKVVCPHHKNIKWL